MSSGLTNEMEGLKLGAIPKSASTSRVPPIGNINLQTPPSPSPSKARRARRAVARKNSRAGASGNQGTPIQPSRSDAQLNVREQTNPTGAASVSAAAAAVVVSRRIQPSKSDAQLNYSAHLSTDRRVPDVLDPTAEVEVEVEEEDSSYSSKKGKNSKRGKRQKRKKQSIASGGAEPKGGAGASGGGGGGGKANKENIRFFDESLPNEDDEDSDDQGESVGGGGRHHVPPDEPKYVWRNVTKNGQIKKCILVDGIMEGGRPKPGDAVLVKTQGKLKDGTIIDDEPSLVFNVGDYEVIEGLDLAVQSMYKNELSIVSIKPELAYGEVGRTKAPSGKTEEVPGNSRITYLFGLLHFEKAKEIKAMTWAQRRKCGQSKMRLANWWHQRKEYPVAVKCYKKALQYYNDIPTNQECSSPEEYKELLQLMEERLRVMRQVANIFKRIANMIQSGQIET